MRLALAILATAVLASAGTAAAEEPAEVVVQGVQDLFVNTMAEAGHLVRHGIEHSIQVVLDAGYCTLAPDTAACVGGVAAGIRP
jgi:hypothetical protein